MPRTTLRPYLIAKDEEGNVRITTRNTRFNSQGYPLVSSKMLDESFASMSVARAYARSHFGAEAADIATK